MKIDILFDGFPGKSSRGFLGWSSCILIRPHPGQAILFDTVGFNERYALLSKLDQLGIDRTEIQTIFLSHFHFDHAVNYPLFENARFYLHEKELEHVKQNGKRDLAVPVEMLPSLEASGRLSILSGKEGTVEGLNWRLTPGHTPGLYSIFVEYNGEKWVLASDAVKNRYELTHEQAAMTWNDKESTQSIQMIKEWADIVVSGHDGLLRITRQNKRCDIEPMYQTSVTISLPDNGEQKGRVIPLEF
ncbi:MBL fold metallo-hydrolase [Aneurinibacillus sp. REN35]|uniref:MBL fold metallo-hydrolase n=1 Tax=Aneurinibacillus sp. REN35 TaxID=3237286 RepID=UPI0035271B2E